jgi:two-component system response regulator PilR (NtrC family)
MLARHFLDLAGRANDRRGMRMTEEALAVLASYSFPGNVRELENLIERAVTLEPGERITRASLPELVPRSAGRRTSADSGDFPDDGVDLERMVADYERDLIQKALERTHGVRKSAAKLLGVSFRSLRYRLAKLGIDGGPSDSDEDDTPT